MGQVGAALFAIGLRPDPGLRADQIVARLAVDVKVILTPPCIFH